MLLKSFFLFKSHSLLKEMNTKNINILFLNLIEILKINIFKNPF